MKKLYIALFFTILAITSHAQNTWTGLTGPSGGRISDVQNDGTTKIFTLNQDFGAIFRSTDDGGTWTQITPAGMFVYGMLVETNKVYAIEFGGSGTYFLNTSTDGGATWQRKNTTSSFKAERLYRTPQGIELIAWSSLNGDAYISIDDGVTWTSFYTRAISERIFSVVSDSDGDVFLSSSLGVFRHLHPSAGQWLNSSFANVYPATVGTVYNQNMGIDASNKLYLLVNSYNGSNIDKLVGSDTNGNSWTDLLPTSGFSTPSFSSSQLFCSSNGVFLTHGNPQKIYKSSGFNLSWTEYTTSPGAAYTNTQVTALKFIPTTTKAFIGTSGDGVFISLNATPTPTWSLATKGINSLDGRDVKFTSTGRILYLVNSGLGYWYSDNQGVDWSFKQISSIYSMNEIIVSGTTLIAYGAFSNVYQSTNNGDTWISLPETDPSTQLLNGIVVKGTELYASASNGGGTINKIYKSIDYGGSWTSIGIITGLPANSTFGGIQPGLVINGNNKLVVPVKNTTANKWELYEVALTGGAATKLPVDLTTNVFGKPTSFFAVGNKIYWSDDTYIYLSTDNGATWKTITFSNQKVIPVITYGTPNRNGIGASRYGVFFTSADDGLSWNSFTSPNSSSVIRSVATNASNVSYAAASFSPALKYVSPLAIDPATLPPYVNFDWAPLGIAPLGGPYGGYMSKVLKGNSGKLFLVAGYNLYNTTNMSTAWTKVVDPSFNFGLLDIIVEPGTGHFYTVGGQHLFKSTNEGQNWTQVSTTGIFNAAPSIQLTSSGIFWANDATNVRRSLDGGVTWSTVYSSSAHVGYDDNTIATKSDTIFIVDSNAGGIVRSTNANVTVPTFTPVNNGLATPTSTPYFVTFAQSEAIAWSYQNIYRYNAGTNNWDNIKGNLPSATISSVFCKTDMEYYIFAQANSTGSGVYRTLDGGATWTKLYSGDLQASNVIFDGTTNLYASVVDDQFYHSADNGTTWTQWSTGINELYPYNIRMINNQRLFFTTMENSRSSSFVSLDKGATWTKTTPALSRIFPMPDGSYLATGGSNLYKSTDGGATWPVVTTNGAMKDIATADGITFYGISGTAIYTKTASGAWNQLAVTGLPVMTNPIDNVAVDADNKAYIIFKNQNNSYKPDLYQIAFGSAYKMNFTTNPVNIQFYKGKTYAFDGAGTLYSTVDGATWTSKASPTGTKFIIGHLDYFFILDYNGAVWLSRDLGTTWQNVGDSMTQSFVDVFFNPNDGVVYGAVQGNYQRKSKIILPQETQAPLVNQVSPSTGPTNPIDLLTPVTLQITFDEMVNPVAGKKIKIVDLANPGTPLGTMDVTLGTQNGSTFTFNPATFTPAVTFSYTKIYFISIDPGAFVDVNAVPNAFVGIVGTNTWRFSTRTDDLQSPIVITKSPVDNATGVAYNTTLQITFDENIYAGSGKTIKLYDASLPATPLQTFSATNGVITGGKTVTFTPSFQLVNGKSYYILVDAGAFTDLFGNSYAGITSNLDWNFTALYIDVQAPVVSTFTPANNATDVSFSPTLQLTFNEDIQTVGGKTLRIYDSSAPSTPIGTIDALTGTISGGKTVSYIPSTVLSGSKTYHVLVDAGAIKDLAGNLFSGISSNTVWKFSTILVDTQAPVLTLFAPTNNQSNVAIGTTLSLTFDENIKATTGKKIKLFDSTDPVTPIENIDASAGTISAKSITFTLTKALTGSKTYYVLIDNGAITDIAGNAFAGISSTTTWRFSTDAIAPSLTQLTPANNSTDISFSPTLELRFDEDILAVTGKKIDLYVAGSANPVATVDASTAVITGKVATFTLANALISSSVYHVLVANGAFTDISGNPFVGITLSSEWTFTTRDGLPPVITLLEPADDATEVSLTSTLKITFNENITKVLGKKLVLYEASQPSTPLKTMDISTGVLTGKTLSFIPGNILAYNKSYFVLVESGAVADASGNEFLGIGFPTQWQFSTETDSQKPAIAYSGGGDLTKGSGSYLIAATITDNKLVGGAKVFYRGISSESSGAFTSSSLVLNSSTSKYEFSVPESAYDKYGIEFYLEASDVAGNSVTSPAIANNFYYSYLKFSAASAPPLAGLAFGGTLASYRMISVPYKLADNKVTTIFAELGSANKSKWRLLTYFSDTKWNDYPTDFTTIERGVGYWINIKDATEIFIEGASTEGTNKSTLFGKTFNPGWNQIGNPYPVAISWNAIKAAIPAASSLGVLKVYKDGFQNGDILQPLEGGFVFNSGAAVTISIPLPASAGGRQNNFVETRLDNPNWALDINMKQGEVKYELAGIGMHPQANLQFDAFDDLNPPHFADYAEIQFPHPSEIIKKFSRDVVPTQNSYTWEFEVDSNLPGLSELYWNNTRFGENSKELYLYDVELQKLVDMRTESKYQFDARTSSRFKIFFGDDLKKEIKPERITLGIAYPNPAQSQTTIPFTLSENGSVYHVSLEIFDSMGKKVGTLVQGDFTSGFYNAIWDFSGAQSAQGIYHVRLEAKSRQGIEIRSGKIVISK